MTEKNALRAYESYRTGKKIIVDITGQLPCVYFFTHEVMSIRVHRNFICYLQKFRAIIGRNFISVHGTSLVKYRVYNIIYARTSKVSKGINKNLYIRPLVKVSRNTVAINLLLLIYCDFIVWKTRLFIHIRHYAHFMHIRSWYSQETICQKKMYVIILLDPILTIFE